MSSETPEPEQNKESSQTQRDSMLGSVVSSVKFLQDAHSEVGVIKIRKSDKFTLMMLGLALIIMVAAALMPSQRSLCSILADALMAIVLLAFLGLRFGVIKSLQPRQAVLTWQLILGSFLLGIYLVFNIWMFMLMRSGVHFGS